MSNSSNKNYYISLARHSILEATKHLNDTEGYLNKIGYVFDIEKVQRKSAGLLTIYQQLGKELEDEIT
jgi:hypothetical protein